MSDKVHRIELIARHYACSITTATRAYGAYQGYEEWKGQTQLKAAEPECSLVSRRYRFGGTLDALLIKGALALGDVKTGKQIYHDFLLQLGAYALLWEENFPDRQITGGFHILRFSKQELPDDPIAFSHHFWSDLDLAKRQFLLLREAYDNDKRLNQLV